MSKQLLQIVPPTAANPIPEIRLYGYIGQGKDALGRDMISAEAFQKAFDPLAAKHPEMYIRFNTNGGSIFDGLLIYDTIAGSKCKTIGVVEGVAASMGAIILQACKVRQMKKHSRLMTHKAQGGYTGEAEGMRAYADMIEQEEAKITDVLVERTGKSVEVVMSWLKPGTMKWIGSAEALENNLCDEVLPNGAKIPNNAFKGELQEIINSYNEQLIDNTNDMKKILFAALAVNIPAMAAMTDDTPDQTVITEIQNSLTAKDTEIENLKAQIKSHTDATMKALLDDAENEGRITKAQRPGWETMLTNSFTEASAALAGIPKRIDVNKVIADNKKSTDPSNSTKGSEAWTYREWEQKNPTGLLEMKNTDFDAFNALFKDHTGVDFKA